MNPQRYALIVAIIFAAIAVLQLARAMLDAEKDFRP
jgi:hypothetical protein